MSKLKDTYTSAGYEYERLGHSCWYLSELASCAAMDIDNHLLGVNNGFEHVQELAEILGKYQLKDTDTFVSSKDFPYLPLWRAIKGNNLDRNHISELALRMGLLRLELETTPESNPPRLKGLTSFLCNLSKEFQSASK